MNYRWAIAFNTAYATMRQAAVRRALLGATESHVPTAALKTPKLALNLNAPKALQWPGARKPTFRWGAGATESAAPPARM